MKKDKNLKYKIMGLLSAVAIVGGSIYSNINTDNNNDLIDTEPMEVAEEVEVDTSAYDKDLEILEFTLNNNLDPHVRNSVVDGLEEDDIVIIGVNDEEVANVDGNITEPQFAPKEVEEQIIENKNDVSESTNNVVEAENPKDIVEQPKDEVVEDKVVEQVKPTEPTKPKEDNEFVVEKPKPTDPPKSTGNPFVDNPALRPVGSNADNDARGAGAHTFDIEKNGEPGKGDKF